MTLDDDRRPVVELGPHVVDDADRLGSEGVAGEVRELGVARGRVVLRQHEAVPRAADLVRGVACDRLGLATVDRRRGHDPSSLCSWNRRDEALKRRGIEVLGTDPPGRGEDRLDLDEVARAAIAGSEVPLEGAAVASRQHALEVVRHQLHRLPGTPGPSSARSLRSSSCEPLQCVAHLRASSVQDHPHVALGHTEKRRDLVRRQSLYVAKRYDRLLRLGEVANRRVDRRGHRCVIEMVLDELGERRRRVGPRAVLVEPRTCDRRLDRRWIDGDLSAVAVARGPRTVRRGS